MSERGVYVLLVDHDEDYDPAVPHGPFESVVEAQQYAERFRARQGLPVEATSENNEEWTERGWYFGIFPLTKEARITRGEAVYVAISQRKSDRQIVDLEILDERPKFGPEGDTILVVYEANVNGGDSVELAWNTETESWGDGENQSAAWCSCGAKTMQGSAHKPGCPAREAYERAHGRTR